MLKRFFPMPNQIHWQLFLRAKTEERADWILTQITEALQLKPEKVHREKYWKDQALFRIALTVPITAEHSPEAVMETLDLCSQLAHRWVIGPPQFYETGEWEFSGSAEKATIRIPSLTDIDFQVGNLRAWFEKTSLADVEIHHP